MRYSQTSCGQSLTSQRGAFVTAIVFSLLLVTGGVLLGNAIVVDIKQVEQQAVTDSLARAKEALISYAVTYTDNYGHNVRGGVGRLPCPAKYPHSSPALSCGRDAIGYLPAVWNRRGKRINIDHLEYFLHQNLWYAVSPEFRYNPAYNRLNSALDSGFFKVHGRDDIVAVIVHPGPEMEGQQRHLATTEVEHYLEAENADRDSIYAYGTGINDRIITISREELMPLVERRVLGVVKEWLLEYYEEYDRLPFAAQPGDPSAKCVEGLLEGFIALNIGNCVSPSLGELVSSTIPKGRTVEQTWFGSNGWSQFIYYHVEARCTVSDCAEPVAGTVLTVDALPVKALLVSVGREIKSEVTGSLQNRQTNPHSLASYLDTTVLLDAGLSYQISGMHAARSSNDQLVVIR